MKLTAPKTQQFNAFQKVALTPRSESAEAPSANAAAVEDGLDVDFQASVSQSDKTTKASAGKSGKWLKTAATVGGAVALTLAGGTSAFAQTSEIASTVAASGATASAGSNILTWAPLAIGGIIAGVAVINLMRSTGGGAGMGGSGGIKSHKFDWVDKVDKRFDDVAGIQEAKTELMEMVDMLKHPENYASAGAKMPRGALLEGPPGTGKTLLAEAVAGESGLPFVKVTGSEFVEKYVGVGASRVRELFAAARKKAKEGGKDGGAIIFIDEIDAIGGKRTGEGNNAERESTLNQILTEMSGFKEDDNILVMAATNRAELLDSALTRSGRFDRKVRVDAPSRDGREAILKIHARGKKLAEGVSLADVAARTPGLVGADMESIMNEAAIYATREKSEAITMKHLSKAIDKVVMGEQRSGTLLSQKERISTAYHEGGHAILARALPSNGDLHKVTILPRGKALGVTWTASEDDKYGYSKDDLLDRIAMLLAGRAAEELKFGEITTGASNDIERATGMANRIVSEFGMDDDVGLINLSKPKATGFRPSAELSNTASQKVKDILDDQYDRAMEILKKNESALDDISEGMLDHEELDRAEIEDILSDRVVVERKELDLEQFRPANKRGKGPISGPRAGTPVAS